MPDNLDQSSDNLDQTTSTGIATAEGNIGTQTAPAPNTAQPAANTTATPESFSWKSQVGEDLSKAPSLGKFEDSKAGLSEVAKSYVNLEKLLGHEKVPLPKGPEDQEGRAAFNKAIGVPPSPEQYNLPDREMPGGIEAATQDKGTFQGVMHKYGLTPEQAQGLWKEYNDMASGAYQKIQQDYSARLDQNINALRKEWGDAYAGNVELGQMVINKFADDNKQADFLTANLAKDPAGLKFLAKIGSQFAENKVGDFQYKRFSMTPEEAKNEVARIKADPNHAYRSEKATDDDHQNAVEHVNRLIAISMGKTL